MPESILFDKFAPIWVREKKLSQIALSTFLLSLKGNIESFYHVLILSWRQHDSVVDKSEQRFKIWLRHDKVQHINSFLHDRHKRTCEMESFKAHLVHKTARLVNADILNKFKTLWQLSFLFISWTFLYDNFAAAQNLHAMMAANRNESAT